MTGLRNLPVDLMESWFCFLGRILKDLNRQPIMWDDHFSQRMFATKHCPNATQARLELMSSRAKGLDRASLEDGLSHR